MAERKAFPLRISKDLYEDLRQLAEVDMRSVNAQIEFMLRKAIRRRKSDSPNKDP